ncbi:MAG TPA: 2-phospho-L-lactate guanylyltransferase [Acidimicrobiia bacterium]|jgi:2-phospho-L-lactate guanylyltransferase
MPVIGVPIKPFGVAKARLSGVVDAAARSRLGMAIAAHTVSELSAADVPVVVVTGDADVAAWAKSLGHEPIDEAAGDGTGLNAAGSAVARHAARMSEPWLLVHADLPMLRAADIPAMLTAAADEGVIAPSHDGGTNVIGGTGPGFRFQYGHGSFAKHLGLMPRAEVLVTPELAYDLDTPDDLRLILSHPRGMWIADLVPAQASR